MPDKICDDHMVMNLIYYCLMIVNRGFKDPKLILNFAYTYDNAAVGNNPCKCEKQGHEPRLLSSEGKRQALANGYQ